MTVLRSRRPLTGWLETVGMLIVAAMLAGCSSAGHTAAPATPSGVTGSSEVASTDTQPPGLLTLTDLPEGWEGAANVDPPSSLKAACMSAFGHGRLPGQTGVRGTGYTFGGDAPALLEIVGAFGSGQAARAFPSFVQGLNGCSYPAEVGGQAVVSRLAPLSAAKVGAASATYTSSLGAAYSAVVVAVEKGEAIALIIYIDRGTPNDVAAMNVASAAAARL